MKSIFAEKKIRQFLEAKFPLVRSVDNHAALLGTGLLDSLGVLEIVGFVEREFGVCVSDEDLLPENFGSIEAIADFVAFKIRSLNEPA